MFKVKIPAHAVTAGESIMIAGTKHTVLSTKHIKLFDSIAFVLMPVTKKDPAQTVELYVPQDQIIELCWFK